MKKTIPGFAALFTMTLIACAQDRREAQSPASKAPEPPAAEAAPAGAYPATPGYPQASAQPGAYPQQQPGMPPPPPAPSGGGTSRAVALQNATRDVESSQRELDVAAGDCQNACRALGSMDRAAGHVCALASGEGEGRRCDDAKQRVYTARARVKTTCGQCTGVSVERTDPIPSAR